MINKKSVFVKILPTALIIVALSLWLLDIPRRPRATPTTVNCVMVTLNDSFRRSYVEKSIGNFHAQTYPHKRLVILEQSPDGVLPGVGWKAPNVRVIRVPVPHSHTLGGLRNLVLDTLSTEEIWTTWDDDDWRDPTYIDVAVHELHRKRSDFMMLTQRVDYNLPTQFAHGVTLKSGLYASTFAYVNKRIRYDDLDTMEDQCIKRLGFENAKNPTTMTNDPLLYMRLVHGNNTSRYVRSDKTRVLDTVHHKDFFEWDVTPNQLDRVREILSTYYNISCPTNPISKRADE